MNDSTIDYDGILHANLVRVFNERDADRRMQALRELYAEDAVLYEPHAAVTGHAAISATVTALLASLPPGFSFAADAPAVGHHGVGHLRWHAGPAAGEVTVTGMDIAHIDGKLIRSLYVFIDA